MDERKVFSIQVCRENYIKLMRMRHKIFDDLKKKDVIRNVSFDDAVTDLLVKYEMEEKDNGYDKL